MPTFSNPALGAAGNVTAVRFQPAVSKTAWWGQDEFVIEIRYLNTFSNDPVPARDTHRLVRKKTGRERVATGLGEAGYTQCEVIDQDFVRNAFMISQAYQVWRIDKSLQSYYDFVTGYDLGVPAAGAGLAAAPTAWAGKGLIQVADSVVIESGASGLTLGAGGLAMEAGATFLGLAAFGYSCFYLATSVVQANLPAGQMLSTGWEFVGIGFGPEVASAPVTHWIRC